MGRVREVSVIEAALKNFLSSGRGDPKDIESLTKPFPPFLFPTLATVKVARAFADLVNPHRAPLYAKKQHVSPQGGYDRKSWIDHFEGKVVEYLVGWVLSFFNPGIRPCSFALWERGRYGDDNEDSVGNMGIQTKSCSVRRYLSKLLGLSWVFDWADFATFPEELFDGNKIYVFASVRFPRATRERWQTMSDGLIQSLIDRGRMWCRVEYIMTLHDLHAHNLFRQLKTTAKWLNPLEKEDVKKCAVYSTLGDAFARQAFACPPRETKKPWKTLMSLADSDNLAECFPERVSERARLALRDAWNVVSAVV
jgi:hypothetical protein